MEELAQKGSAHIKTYTVANLKDPLHYEFMSDVYKRQGIKKAGLANAEIEFYHQAGMNNGGNVDENENNVAADMSASDVGTVTQV